MAKEEDIVKGFVIVFVLLVGSMHKLFVQHGVAQGSERHIFYRGAVYALSISLASLFLYVALVEYATDAQNRAIRSIVLVVFGIVMALNAWTLHPRAAERGESNDK